MAGAVVTILVDANLLLYAYDADSPHHRLSCGWLEAEISSGRPVCLALITLLAFVRIASDRRVSHALCRSLSRAPSSKRG